MNMSSEAKLVSDLSKDLQQCLTYDKKIFSINDEMQT